MSRVTSWLARESAFESWPSDSITNIRLFHECRIREIRNLEVMKTLGKGVKEIRT